MEIRMLQQKDLEQMSVLYEELLHGEKMTMEHMEKMFRKIQKRKDVTVLVAADGDRCMGTVTAVLCYGLDGTFMVVENVVVSKACRRKGVGKSLFEKIDELAEQNNCGYTILVSSDFRKKAHKFYENMGYTDGVKGFRKVYK